MIPLLLVLGPSGAGKSHFGRWLEEEHGWLHLEVDQYPFGSGLDIHVLRREWEALASSVDARPLAARLAGRAEIAGSPGLVATLASATVLGGAQIQAATAAGIRVAYLWAPAATCLSIFRERERRSGRGLPDEHWHACNRRVFEIQHDAALAPHRHEVLDARGERRPLEEVLREIMAA